MVWIEQLQSAHWADAGRIGLGAYFLGCCTTGYYWVRWRTGQDIRQLGSGSVGARNVSRVLGWPGFLITLAGDFSKGLLAVWAAHYLTTDDKLAGLAMLAVVAGHIWPVQLRLRGGKGMATSLGALCVVDFHLALAFGLLFAIGFGFLRKTVFSGLFAFACLPFVSLYLTYDPAGWTYNPGQVLIISLLTSMVLIAHRKNMLQEFLQIIEHFHPKHTPPEL